MLEIKAIRHGEALLLPVEAMPEGKTKKARNYIIAHSETGHHHVLESKTDVEVMDDEELYIRLFEPAKLVHKKTVDAHKTLTIPAGVYKIVHKAEYDPWNQVITRVFD